jgi:hypothetical protein
LKLTLAFAAMMLGWSRATPLLASESTCANERLRHESLVNTSTGVPYSTELAECRGYEMVSPSITNDNAYFAQTFPAASGDAAIFTPIKTGLPGLPSAVNGEDHSYEATRTPYGWVTTSLLPAFVEPNTGGEVIAASPNFFSVVLSSPTSLTQTGGPAGSKITNFFEWEPNGDTSWVSQGPLGQPTAATQWGGATADMSHLVFATRSPLVSQDTHLAGYEVYDRADTNTTQLVGILPDGETPNCGASLASSPLGNAVAEYGHAIGFQSPSDLVNSEPSEYPTCAPSKSPPQLYVRINDEQTLQVSHPAEGVVDTHGTQEAHYAYMTPSGQRVLFTTSGALTSNADTAGDTTDDLYVCEIVEEVGQSACKLNDISATGLADPDGARVQGVLGASQGGDVVYFAAKGRLTSQAGDGALNLYVWAEGRLSYIAALGDDDARDWSNDSDDWTGKTTEVTPDGSDLLFESTVDLAGATTNGFSEIYRYELAGGRLSCVSCGGTSVTPAGNARLATQTAGDSGSMSEPLSMTDDGKTVVFVSPSRLLSENRDMEPEPEVYEWHNGNLALITPANGNEYNSQYPTILLGATPSGGDVFFSTSQSLVPEDENSGDRDVYDARVDGGFPAPPTPEKQCESIAECRNGTTTLSAPTIASLTPGAVGNVPPPRTVPKPRVPSSPSRAALLRRALARCKRLKGAKGKSCETAARKKYGPKSKSKLKPRQKKKGET